MAKAAAINLNDVFSPPPQTHVVTPPSTYGDFLPSLSNSAGPGPGSAASQRFSGQVRALSASRERASTGSSYASKRQSGLAHTQSNLSTPATAPSQPSESINGVQHNPKLPPLMHGYGTISPGRMGTGTPSTVSQHGDKQHQHGEKQPQGTHGEKQLVGEAIQPMIQHPSILPGPTPAAHPYQPKRKPPSAFMRNNPMLQQLEQQQQQSQQRSTSAGSGRSHYGLYDNVYGVGGVGEASYGGGAISMSDIPNEAQAQQFAAEVIAAAEAAIAQGRLQQAWTDENAMSAASYFMSVPPWGVSSVSDLEALDSILDQLVVVDARMRKALLKGPLISFETVVPEHIVNPAAAAARQQQQEEEKDRTFLTSVKGVAEEEQQCNKEEESGGAQQGPDSAVPPPPSPAELEASSLAGAFAAATSTARQVLRPVEEITEPRDSALFPASIPNPGMHPTFTRAYLASKMAAKPQHLPPPPPATAEHLLRSRPPPFIAAPTYDQLCSQIRDVQRQYTCGSSRPPEKGATSVGAGPGGLVTASSITAAIAAGVPIASTTHQYIAGLDGPTLDEMITHQELPISLERVRPTFVALKQKARSSASPRRRPTSPGRATVYTGVEGQGSGAL